MNSRWSTAAAVVLAAIFGLASLAKLADPAGFAFQLEDFGVPPGASWPAAWVIALSELTLAAGLLAPRHRRRSATIASVALIAFAVVMSLHHGENIECGCFGSALATRLTTTHIAADLFLSASAFVVALKAPAPIGHRV
ncbi:MAG TPA: MauE/DoxX family redox-associated membrane protein [Vicinamibacterales bacterium]|nr:MauE/DoxX family redox-associated membrane protein [Vicinamibacterales bacterium]